MNPELLNIFELPFKEQEAYFKEKLNIPTLKWDDLVKDQHAKGFMVAGAYKADLLSDFRDAVEKAIEKGTTLEEFRKDFDRIVNTHGWSYNGGRNWRSEVIYNTNIRQSYNAGRWAQLTDPEQLQVLPYLTYAHGDSRHPRLTHLSWDGITLPADDPWWDTHMPQNGWGCKCRVYGSTRKEYAKAQTAGKGEAPPSPIDPKTGAPVGIDKGFDYNPGKAAFGKSWVPETGAVKELGPWRKEQYPFLPKKLSGDKPPVALGRKTQGNVEALRASIPEGIYQDKLGESVSVTQNIADHILDDPAKRWDGREQYFPLIPDIVKNPQEIWVGFMQHVDGGRVFLRKRYIKAYEIENGRVVGLLADETKGQMVSIDVIRSEKPAGGRMRSGRLIYQDGQK